MSITVFKYPPWLSETKEYERLCSCLFLSNALYKSKPLQYLNSLNEEKHGFHSIAVSEQQFRYIVGFKDDEVIVAFKGSKDVKDFFTDLNPVGNENSLEGVFHSGFYQIAAAIPLEPFIYLLKQGNQIVFTGHCLGGAIAQICCARLMADQRTDCSKIFCVTFGAPCVAEDGLKKFVHEKGLSNFHHYLNEDDWIPQLFTLIENCRSHDPTLTNTLQQFVENNLKRALCEEFEQKEMFSLKNLFYSSSPVKEFSEMIEEVTKTLKLRFKPFGKYFIIANPQMENYDNEIIVTQFMRSAKGENLFLDTAKILSSKIAPSGKYHVMEYYVNKLTEPIRENGKFSYLLFEHCVTESKFFDPTQWKWSVHDKNSKIQLREHTYSVLIIKMKDKEEVKITLHGGPLLSLITRLRIGNKEARLHSSVQTKLVFVAYLHKDDVPKKVKFYTHFGSAEFDLDPKRFLSGNMLYGKKKKISDLDVIDLYKYAFTYSLFTGVKSFFKKKEKDTSKRMEVLKILTDMENRWKKECKDQEKTILESKKFQDDLREQLVYIMKENEETDDTKTLEDALKDTDSLIMPTEITYITDIIKDYSASKITTAVEALTTALPHLLMLQEQLIPDICIKGSLEKPILMGLGLAVLTGGLVAVGWSVFAAFVGVTGVSAISIIGVMMGIFKKEYERRLNYYAESLGLFVDEIREHPFFFEEAIFKHCEKVGMTVQSNEYIIKNWEKYFPNAPLAFVKDDTREQTLKVLRTLWDHYRLRVLLFSDISIGVVGTGKAGKSTIINKLFGFNTHPSSIKRTEDMKPYYPIERFHIIDFPHLNSTREKLKACFQANHQLVDAVIVVFEALQHGDTTDSKRVISLLNKLKIPYIALFNKAELVWLNDSDEAEEESGDDDYSGDESNNSAITDESSQPEEKRPLTADELENCRKNMYTLLKIPDEQCYLTCLKTSQFSPDELRKVGIKGAKEVMDWICNFLEQNEFSTEEIERVRNTAALRKQKAKKLKK